MPKIQSEKQKELLKRINALYICVEPAKIVDDLVACYKQFVSEFEKELNIEKVAMLDKIIDWQIDNERKNLHGDIEDIINQIKSQLTNSNENATDTK